ncbi:secretory phospholipase A2 receptor-like [Diadema setosum]|uniref:secretory phospholipase A2 receptor-like n=1 Tax=Diadema setosum TaxID=31175 RepID=UPI003B3BAA8E
MYSNAGSCYLFETNEVDHATASSACSDIGFHLLFIETASEQQYVRQTGRSVSTNIDYWFGLQGSTVDSLEWLDGTPATYNNLGFIDEGGHCFRLKHEQQRAAYYRLIKDNTALADSSILSEHKASSLLRCAGLCNHQSTCHYFTLVTDVDACLLGNASTIADSVFVAKFGARTYSRTP